MKIKILILLLFLGFNSYSQSENAIPVCVGTGDPNLFHPTINQLVECPTFKDTLTGLEWTYKVDKWARKDTLYANDYIGDSMTHIAGGNLDMNNFSIPNARSIGVNQTDLTLSDVFINQFDVTKPSLVANSLNSRKLVYIGSTLYLGGSVIPTTESTFELSINGDITYNGTMLNGNTANDPSIAYRIHKISSDVGTGIKVQVGNSSEAIIEGTDVAVTSNANTTRITGGYYEAKSGVNTTRAYGVEGQGIVTQNSPSNLETIGILGLGTIGSGTANINNGDLYGVKGEISKPSSSINNGPSYAGHFSNPLTSTEDYSLYTGEGKIAFETTEDVGTSTSGMKVLIKDPTTNVVKQTDIGNLGGGGSSNSFANGIRAVSNAVELEISNLTVTPAQIKGSDFLAFANSTDDIDYKITADDLGLYLAGTMPTIRYETIDFFGVTEDLSEATSQDSYYVTIEEVGDEIISWRPIIHSGTGTCTVELLKNGAALVVSNGQGAGQGGSSISSTVANNDVFQIKVSNLSSGHTLKGLQVKLQIK